mgnify:FL=1
MAIYKKGYYWKRQLYNSKTGLFKGEESFSTSDGFSRDWMGKPVNKQPERNYGMGKNGWDD